MIPNGSMSSYLLTLGTAGNMANGQSFLAQLSKQMAAVRSKT